jgi:hypothetical protein
MPGAPLSRSDFGYQPPETCAAMWKASKTAGTQTSLRS